MADEMDEPSSPEPDPGYIPEPRITNRAQGGVRNDKTRFIRPVERQRMRPWLIEHLDKKDIPGLDWQQKEASIFKISWKHAANQCFNLETDTNLFERWAIHTGRHYDSDHKRWKANFRCALNSLPDVEELKDQGVKKGNNAFKVYRFLGEQEVKSGKPRKKKEARPSFAYADEGQDEDDEVGGWRQQNSTKPVKLDPDTPVRYYRPDEDSEDTETEGAVSGIPNLQQLVPGGSGVDMLLEAGSKERFQPVTSSMDNLQEILEAATAALEAGSDALALEKISIEQLSRLGEVSKIILDIRQSDRKRRKKEVSGRLSVFVCSWCEKVFPAKKDLFQHFLTVHQDKLLSGEEYGARQHLEGSETLQQEIADLEKKVLGFTQETFPVKESEEVIEDGQVVDMSSNNSMTSQDVYIEDQALDLSVAGALARHPVTTATGSLPHPEIVALDLSVSSIQDKTSTGQKNGSGGAKPVTKRRRSQAMDMDYTLKFSNYGLAGAPRTKRQLSLLLKKREEEKEKERKHAEAQHSMEDIVHAEILMSLKSAPKEETESESMEVEEGKESEETVKQENEKEENTSKVKRTILREGVNEVTEELSAKADIHAVSVIIQDSGEPDVKKQKLTESKMVKLDISNVQAKLNVSENVILKSSNVDNEAKAVGNKSASDMVVKAYRCGICSDGFEDPAALLEHVSKHRTEFRCYVCSMIMHDKDEYLHHLEGHLPKMQYEKTCNVCGEILSSIEEFARHEKSHMHVDAMKGYLCKYCAKVYLRKDACLDCERQHESKEDKPNESKSEAEESAVVDATGAAGAMKSDKSRTVVEGNRIEKNEELEEPLKTGEKCTETGQKNLRGEPAGAPAAGSENLSGPKIGTASLEATCTVTVGQQSGSSETIDVAKLVSKHSKIIVSHSEDKTEVESATQANEINKAVNQKSVVIIGKEAHLDDAVNKTNNEQTSVDGEKNEHNVPDEMEQQEGTKDFVVEHVSKHENFVVNCGYCDKKLSITDISAHLKSHQALQKRKESCLKANSQYICIICNKPIPAQLYDKHVKSHSVFELSCSEALINKKPQSGIYSVPPTADYAKNILVCNLCFCAFDSFTELKSHVYSHLGSSKGKLESDVSENNLNDNQNLTEKKTKSAVKQSLNENKIGIIKSVMDGKTHTVYSKQSDAKVKLEARDFEDENVPKVLGDESEVAARSKASVDPSDIETTRNRRTSMRSRQVSWSKGDESAASPYRFTRKYTIHKVSGSDNSNKGLGLAKNKALTTAAFTAAQNVKNDDLDEGSLLLHAPSTGSAKCVKGAGVKPIVFPVSLVKNLHSVVASSSMPSLVSKLKTDSCNADDLVSTSTTEALVTSTARKIVPTKPVILQTSSISTSPVADSKGNVGSIRRLLESECKTYADQQANQPDVTLLNTSVHSATLRTTDLPDVSSKGSAPLVLQKLKVPVVLKTLASSTLPVPAVSVVSPRQSLPVTTFSLATSKPLVTVGGLKPTVPVASVNPTASVASLTNAATETLPDPAARLLKSSIYVKPLTEESCKIQTLVSVARPTLVQSSAKDFPIPAAVQATTFKLVKADTVPVVEDSHLKTAGSDTKVTRPTYIIKPGMNTVSQSELVRVLSGVQVLSSAQVVHKAPPQQLVQSTFPQVVYAPQQVTVTQPQGKKPPEYKIMWLPSKGTTGVLHSLTDTTLANKPTHVQVLQNQQNIVPVSQPMAAQGTSANQIMFSIPSSIVSHLHNPAPTIVSLKGVTFASQPKSIVAVEEKSSRLPSVKSISLNMAGSSVASIGSNSTRGLVGSCQPMLSGYSLLSSSVSTPKVTVLKEPLAALHIVQPGTESSGLHTGAPQPASSFVDRSCASLVPKQLVASVKSSSPEALLSPVMTDDSVTDASMVTMSVDQSELSNCTNASSALTSPLETSSCGLTASSISVKCSSCNASFQTLEAITKHTCIHTNAKHENAYTSTLDKCQPLVEMKSSLPFVELVKTHDSDRTETAEHSSFIDSVDKLGSPLMLGTELDELSSTHSTQTMFENTVKCQGTEQPKDGDIDASLMAESDNQLPENTSLLQSQSHQDLHLGHSDSCNIPASESDEHMCTFDQENNEMSDEFSCKKPEVDAIENTDLNIITLYPCAICKHAFTLETILEHSKTHLEYLKDTESKSTFLPLDVENA